MTTIVLFGGQSDERHVSVASAQNVARVLGRPLCWFWAPDGRVYDVSVEELAAHQNPFKADFAPSRPAVFPDLEQALDTLPVEAPVFFLALHGGSGENGTVQSMLETRGIAFTGSGAAASSAAFDKGRAKELLRDKVRTAESRIAEGAEVDAAARSLLERHARIVLKPLAGGSSRGLFFLGKDEDPADTIRKVAESGVPYIIEQFISGRELTVGVIDNGEGVIALPVVEIEVEAGHAFDYEGKYLGKGTREVCPANIDEEVARSAKQVALVAHLTLGCEGYSRSDLMAAEDAVYFLELNTLPGMTTSSLVPQELRAAGIEFRDFLEQQLELAVERAGESANVRSATA